MCVLVGLHCRHRTEGSGVTYINWNVQSRALRIKEVTMALGAKQEIPLWHPQQRFTQPLLVLFPKKPLLCLFAFAAD